MQPLTKKAHALGHLPQNASLWGVPSHHRQTCQKRLLVQHSVQVLERMIQSMGIKLRTSNLCWATMWKFCCWAICYNMALQMSSKWLGANPSITSCWASKIWDKTVIAALTCSFFTALAHCPCKDSSNESLFVGIQYEMVTDTAKVSFLMATDWLGLSFHPTHSFAMPVV